MLLWLEGGHGSDVELAGGHVVRVILIINQSSKLSSTTCKQNVSRWSRLTMRHMLQKKRADYKKLAGAGGGVAAAAAARLCALLLYVLVV